MRGREGWKEEEAQEWLPDFCVAWAVLLQGEGYLRGAAPVGSPRGQRAGKPLLVSPAGPGSGT